MYILNPAFGVYKDIWGILLKGKDRNLVAQSKILWEPLNAVAANRILMSLSFIHACPAMHALCERWRGIGITNLEKQKEKRIHRKLKYGPKKEKRQYHISPSQQNKENQRDLCNGPPLSLFLWGLKMKAYIASH